MDRNSKEFKDLKRKWDDKLEKSGFKDVERNNGELDQYESIYFHYRYTPTTFDANEEYYRIAGHFLHDHSFKSNLAKMIWEEHTKGTYIRDIVKVLKDKGIKTYRRQVHETIQSLRNLMLAKYKSGF